ncbi:proteasome ATPase [Corynebacterium sp. 153RC1]|uniref:proteasome ATPase n=1 Tax=unclassified Corynebacterium TaxID=2624378 RepID=UPI00211C7A0A|nr:MULTISPECIES: proteasome ATPase [unclassified Corynebacterium]MCQ9352440.1 proteasome ATPase [Corynebacterium sp. 209RC1]MCQ9354388.1 proteasome ATPase [Corynebacterium sp. 1222RC1]MCQ9356723.1 proteasome ATPase [Corynebacterium sp. 122RC1]MCQ9358783.1 proteasome ATPase [Corynebacterium sp. 142RC1]MCQ9361181.1 proteasome ATPase [Corynebacterium sp. 153RC1]
MQEASHAVTDPHELRRANAALGARNQKLAELLKATRDKMARLTAQLEELAVPPSTYGTFLEFSSSNSNAIDAASLKYAEVFTAGRRMRLAISPRVDTSELVPGVMVRLGEASQIVETCGFDTTGSLATLVEMVGTERALVAEPNGEEQVLRLAQPLTEQFCRRPRAGDTVLVDAKAGYIFEVIPKTEVAKLALEEVPDVTYQDIGGLDRQIEQIQDAVELPFAHPDLYREYDLKPPKGVLLYGPPGCGKTLIAKAVANSLAQRIGNGSQSYFINVKGPELLNKFVGETERRIRLIFERARELAEEGRPVIVFFDEMESIFRTRGSGVSSDMETTVVPQLLTELDGVEGLSNVIVIGATNREELIDPAILRPGRLDVKIKVERPNAQDALEIFARYLTPSVPTQEPVARLIEQAVEYMYRENPFVELTLFDGTTELWHYRDFASGAMIANVVDRAKKLAIKEQIATHNHLEPESAQRKVGIAAAHLRAAIDAENRENEDLPNTANPDEWSRIIGRQGAKVVQARIFAAATSTAPQQEDSA